jgi:ribosomal protein L7Ae-like RNA K-turn-binding protein
MSLRKLERGRTAKRERKRRQRKRRRKRRRERISWILTKVMKTRSPRAEALALLGLAQRAGAVVKGTAGVRQALKRNEVKLLVLAEDGSSTQREKVLPLAEARGVHWETLGTMVELGAAVGSGRLASMALTQRELSEEVLKRLGRERNQG